MVVEFGLDRDNVRQERVSNQWNKGIRLPMIDDAILEEV
jgi:hypothetical protein